MESVAVARWPKESDGLSSLSDTVAQSGNGSPRRLDQIRMIERASPVGVGIYSGGQPPPPGLTLREPVRGRNRRVSRTSGGASLTVIANEP